MKQLTIENFKAMLDNALKNIKERENWTPLSVTATTVRQS